MSENDCWAVVDLMGHVTIAGRVTKPGEYGGLWQIDVPDEEAFRTEFFGSQSVYRIKIVSEEIARAYARPSHEIVEYDAPIVTREEHEARMEQARQALMQAEKENSELRRRLTLIQRNPDAEQPALLEDGQAS